ncbi:MAG: hypothetical protein JRF71_11605 [Deltaproteobacteria bacterium]|nr:hypothetical protein [Deltaproteobacteria bacterium]MBW2201457.1 hypothetical protein [Deltaproteobacteria bacterium]MBW2539210.1 hypothetical protein [Deltaproteobacteria bacterium]
MKEVIAIFTLFFLLACSSFVWGGQDTLHKDHDNSKMPDPGKMQHHILAGTYEYQMVVDGVRAEFQIMSLASMNMKGPDGATHHVMVKLFHDSMNHPIKNATGKVKIIGPGKKEQINPLKNYNGIFAANFAFKETGKYGVICLVKVNGEKHLFKFWYNHG